MSRLDKLKDIVRLRKLDCAKWIEKVLPGVTDEPIPWDELIDRAVEYAAKDGLYDNTYFGRNPETAKEDLKHYMKAHKSGRNGIRLVLLNDLGDALDLVHGGVRKAGVRSARETNEFLQHCTLETVETHNLTATGMRAIFGTSMKTIEAETGALRALTSGKSK